MAPKDHELPKTSPRRDPLQPVSIPPSKRASSEGLWRLRIEPPAEPAKGGEIPPITSATRRDLARLLWGEDESERFTAESMKPVNLPPATGPSSAEPSLRVRPADPVDQFIGRRATLRRACSFPGLLRILLPEVSFQPRVYAVRMVDISPQGARLETRQMTSEQARVIDSERRFARLEALFPTGKHILTGQVAWIEHRGAHTLMGIQFEKDFNGVDEIFAVDVMEDSGTDYFNLSAPKLDAFSSVTSRQQIVFRGEAPEATLVEIRRGDQGWQMPVVEGRFTAPVELQQGRSNFLTFHALQGGRRSLPTPVCVVHRVGAKDTHTVSKGGLVQLFEVDPDGGQLSLELSGAPRHYFQALRLIEKALQHADHLEIRLDLTGDAEKVAKILRPLQND